MYVEHRADRRPLDPPLMGKPDHLMVGSPAAWRRGMDRPPLINGQIQGWLGKIKPP